MVSCASIRRVPLAAIIVILVLACTSVISAEGPVASGSKQETRSTIIVPPAPERPVAKPQTNCVSAVLMDAGSGQVLYSKNAHARLPIASTTKIMTAILIIEHCKMTDTITASKAVSLTPFTSLHLVPGEKISCKDLLTGMLIRSANDAAVAAAEHIAGSTERFAEMMNAKAREIGCRDTHFVTPNGLYDKNHYSSAYDLCLMARYAFQYPIFDEAINTRKYYLNSRTMNKDDLAVFQKSKFLRDYPGADGVKSGYIREAGRCYVGSATRDGWRLVSAVLKSGNTASDTAALMDYGFGNFERLTVAKAGEPCTKAEIAGGACLEVPVEPASDLRVAVPKAGCKITTKTSVRLLEAPVLKGATVGTMAAAVNGKRAAIVDLHAAQDIDTSLARKASAWMKMCGVVVVCLMVGRKYGTAFTKSARRRRRGVETALRSFDRFR